MIVNSITDIEIGGVEGGVKEGVGGTEGGVREVLSIPEVFCVVAAWQRGRVWREHHQHL